MTIRVALNHRTAYSFDRPVKIWPHEVRLRPAAHCRTPVSGYSLRVLPEGHFINWQQDVFGNWVARLVFPEPADHLEIRRMVDRVSQRAADPHEPFLVGEKRLADGRGAGAEQGAGRAHVRTAAAAAVAEHNAACAAGETAAACTGSA